MLSPASARDTFGGKVFVRWDPAANVAGMLDEFRCALPGGKRCVLRPTENGQHIFHELDPITGIGRELYRTAWTPPIAGDWALSPNGSEIAIPNHDSRERRIHNITLEASVARPKERDLIRDFAGERSALWGAESSSVQFGHYDHQRGLISPFDAGRCAW